MSRSVKTLITALLFLLFLPVFPLRADTVVLDNGSEIYGEVIEDNAEYIILKIFEGKGQTRISKERIKYLEKEKDRLKEKGETQDPLLAKTKPQPARMAFREELKKIHTLPRKIDRSFFIISLVPLTLYLFLIFCTHKRPLGIKTICFASGSIIAVFFLLELSAASFVFNRFFLVLKGIDLYLYVLFALVLPVALMITTFFLFFMRNWARRILIGFLIWRILYGGFCLLTQDQMNYNPFQQKEVMAEDVIPEKFENFIPLNVNKNFDWRALNEVFTLIAILMYLYLKQPRLRIAFEKKIPLPAGKLVVSLCACVLLFFVADKGYQSFFIEFTQTPHLFRQPVRAQSIKVSPTNRGRSLKEYHALGYKLWLPTGMGRFKGKTKGPETATFLDRKNGRVFSICKITAEEYTAINVSSRARWNPLLLLIKAVGTPRLPGELVSIEEVKFGRYEGLMWFYAQADKPGTALVFYLEDKKGDYINCVILDKSGKAPSSKEETTAYISLIEKL